MTVTNEQEVSPPEGTRNLVAVEEVTGDDEEVTPDEATSTPDEDDAQEEDTVSTPSNVAPTATRPRAKKREIALRETKAIALLQEQPMSIFHLSRETGISFPRAQNLVARLRSQGKVTELTEGKRTLYKAITKGSAKSASHLAAVKSEEPVVLPPVNSATILHKFHLGREFLVVGVHITEEGEYVELKAVGTNETIRVAVI